MKTVRLSGLVAALVAVFGAGTGAADELAATCSGVMIGFSTVLKALISASLLVCMFFRRWLSF